MPEYNVMLFQHPWEQSQKQGGGGVGNSPKCYLWVVYFTFTDILLISSHVHLFEQLQPTSHHIHATGINI